MKRIVAILAAAILAFGLFGCSSSEQPSSRNNTPTNTQADTQSTSGQSTDAKEEQTKEPVASLSLIGEWEQSNKSSETSYQRATIADNTIEIYWVNTEMDTESLYWAGSYTPPTEATDTYTWDSANDTEKTATALLASGDDTKTFTYSNGKLSYEATALGTTTTIKLSRQ